jgi:serine/threonine protein phosphatase 1
MSRVSAIVDIHGCSKTFKKLLLEKIHIRKSDKIYCIGDYIDRGNDSKGVIGFIMELRSSGYHIHTLRANQEQMMLNAPVNKIKLQHWLKNGGLETMQSMGVKSLDEIGPKYLSFLKKTKFFIKTNKYILFMLA